MQTMPLALMMLAKMTQASDKHMITYVSYLTKEGASITNLPHIGKFDAKAHPANPMKSLIANLVMLLICGTTVAGRSSRREGQKSVRID